MDKFIQNNQSQLFLEQLDNLLDNKIVNSDAEFCRLTGYSPQSFSQIRKGKRNVSPELLESAYKQFRIDILYIFSGEKDVHKNIKSPVPILAKGVEQLEIKTSDNDNLFDDQSLQEKLARHLHLLSSNEKKALETVLDSFLFKHAIHALEKNYDWK